MSRRIICSVTNDIISDRRMIRICSTLSEAGFHVLLVGRKLVTSKPLPKYPFETKRISCRFNKGKWFYAEFNIRLYWFLRSQKADLMGAVDYDTLKAVTKAARKVGARLIFDAHEWFEEVPELEGREKVKRYWMRIASQNIPKTDVRYTVSETIAKKLEERYNSPFAVVRNVPSLAQNEPSSIRENIIVYLGVLNKGRGLEEIIMAMKEIDAQLWLLGHGDIEHDLIKLVDKERLHNKIIFKGFVPPEDIHSVLCQARIGINLLDASSASYEYSLANKFFDYVHAGLPQLCMDFPEYRNLNKEHGVAVTVNDLQTATLVYACNHLLSDRNYWFTIHSNCLRARLDWCWENEKQGLLDLLQ
ncbi:MAG: glycosyltransferase [Saprospiraceae bacterium]|nr:glycosyltransferase [Saprospiraceae bacterium]